MCACIVSNGNISIYIVKGMKLNVMHNINYAIFMVILWEYFVHNNNILVLIM